VGEPPHPRPAADERLGEELGADENGGDDLNAVRVSVRSALSKKKR